MMLKISSAPNRALQVDIYSVLGYCVASQTIVNTYSLSWTLLTFGNSAKIASEG